ncbi:DUF4125 family protein [Atopobium sp. oral taxon 199]|uniref:DUF4125 family protein n=1 Tax=Atopobium sp. oral taxon 199 TaxID=712156 RepID=UPI00034E42E7|nr:DUF4125 family protein [Atopobium sp. oral taxon 199]EPD78859.1 hypothetical protein HMPREF1527_01197 [Atopobium sp. oral taxon 199 str. F0494]
MASLDLVETIRHYEYEDFSYAVKEWSPPYIGCNLNSFFTRMRGPQLMTWSLEVLESYCADLEKARMYHTSLFIERFVYVYGCSKEVSHRYRFPMRSLEFKKYVDFITKISLIWETRARMQFPLFTKCIGPLIVEEDTQMSPSYEVRLRAELMTYSTETIRAYFEFVMQCWDEGFNPNIQTYHGVARELGFPSASEADQLGASL